MVVYFQWQRIPPQVHLKGSAFAKKHDLVGFARVLVLST
ncbi:hypothetical protein GPUN_2693 [Glaciecola punicea ACAM 611]|uniref:Uncharacterized protein n=1 Tax=Glaciecola punicea ACAM 611 TaxID=1121923 RepID=H5TFC7_9ALTE|nr:hypothetical protein GPUN_2693 [Glaciecola punicea ACAM 611]